MQFINATMLLSESDSGLFYYILSPNRHSPHIVPCILPVLRYLRYLPLICMHCPPLHLHTIQDSVSFLISQTEEPEYGDNLTPPRMQLHGAAPECGKLSSARLSIRRARAAEDGGLTHFPLECRGSVLSTLELQTFHRFSQSQILVLSHFIHY